MSGSREFSLTPIFASGLKTEEDVVGRVI